MLKYFQATIISLNLTILISTPALSESNTAVIRQNNEPNQAALIDSETISSRHPIKRDLNGIRSIDLNNKKHEKFVYDRFSTAGISIKNHAHLFAEVSLKKLYDFESSNNQEINLESGDIKKRDSFQKDNIIFSGGEVFTSKDDGKHYFYLNVTNLISDENQTSYLDLVLTDQNGVRIAPIQKKISYGHDTKSAIFAKIPIEELRENAPDLTEVVASSYMQSSLRNGGISSQVKYTKFPFNWEYIDSKIVENNTMSQYPPYTEHILIHPVDSTGVTNNLPDNFITFCYDQIQNDCDYLLDSSMPIEKSLLQIPFKGTLTIPHKITKIYPSDGELPPFIDVSTNIFVQTNQSSSTQHFTPMDNGQKEFSDYLAFYVDEVNKTTTISWDIPSAEGVFGNLVAFSNTDVVNWNISVAVEGYPFFESGRYGRLESFNVILSSHSPYFPTVELTKFKIRYTF